METLRGVHGAKRLLLTGMKGAPHLQGMPPRRADSFDVRTPLLPAGIALQDCALSGAQDLRQLEALRPWWVLSGLELSPVEP
jgi:hypothetical protein